MKREKYFFKKAMSIFLSVLTISQLFVNVTVHAATITDTETASVNTILNVEGVDVNLTKRLQDYGNGLFGLTLSAKASIKTSHSPYSRAYSEDGHYVVPEDGYYLLELYGGEGADGGAVIYEGGFGGAAGHVYGKIYLEAGQTLVFTVGTNGEITRIEDEGGGDNGDGGDHGSLGVSYVGGGGGYSAIYLLDETVERDYVTKEERLSNYILIAGGGGGGGAGPDIEGTSLPNGGRGGSVTSAYGTLSSNDNTVAGTYFAGSNGSSISSNTNYRGQGATYIPGEQKYTLMQEYSTGIANDWAGLENKTAAGGAGGTGNLRGGGGGAGFCGGGGGIMLGLLLPYHIGGGGGGSSFIADTVQYQNLTDTETKYLQDNFSETGGSFNITFLGSGEPDTTAYQNMKVTGYVSKYFDITSIKGWYSNGAEYTGTVTTTTNMNYTTFTAQSVDIEPNKNTGYVENIFHLTLMLRVKDGFAGGNNVPILYDTTSTSYNRVKLSASSYTTQYWEEDDTTDYANVPLNFKITTNSFTSSDTSKSYAISDLYTDEYSSVRESLSSYWQYDFISSISAYNVTVEGSSTALSGTVSPNETTHYTVSYTVVPKTTNVAEIGEELSTTIFSKKATIAIVAANEADFNGVSVAGSKVLQYDGDYYKYGLNIAQETEVLDIPTAFSVSTGGTSGSYVVEKSGWYYIQSWGGNGQGSGASHVGQTTALNHAYGARGTGGAGGYVSGCVYLKEGEIITYTVGETTVRSSASTVISCTTCTSNGLSGSVNHTADQHTANTGSRQAHGCRSTGGAGGTLTKLSLSDGTVLMIAGGGGGAGGSAASASSGNKSASRSGSTGGSNSAISTTLYGDVYYDGSAGTNGSYQAVYNWWGSTTTATAGTAGSAGANYRNANITTATYTTSDGTVLTVPETVKTAARALSTSKTGRAGNFRITCLETDESSIEREKLDDIEAEGTVSKYFEVDGVSLDLGLSGTYTKTVTDNGNNNYTVVYTSDSYEKSRFTYQLETITTDMGDVITKFAISDVSLEATATYGTNTIQYSTDINFTVDLIPTDGFLGGNDIPVAVSGMLGEELDFDNHTDQGVKLISTSEDKFLYLPASDITDYANVDVRYQFDENDLTIYDKTILSGNSVEYDDLWDGTITLTNDWKSEFVSEVYPQSETLTPDKTTEYDISLQVTAKEEPKKAIIVSSAAPSVLSKIATVYVEYNVSGEFSYLTWDAQERILYGRDLDVIITPDSGYLLPEAVTVMIGENILTPSAYSYDSETGRLYIPSSYINGHVTVSATGDIQTFELTFYYPDENGTNGISSYIKEYPAGAAIDLEEWYNKKTAELIADAPQGYEYLWTWEMLPVDGVYYMPAQNWDVIGYYTEINYTLTINYYKSGTTETVAESYVGNVYYGKEYAVVSPNISGYLADKTVVSGTMEGDLIVDVYYEATPNLLTIVYIVADTNEELIEQRISASYDTDTVYSVITPEIYGYTPDQAEVTGIMDADGETVYVYYRPNIYQIVFDVNSADGVLESGSESKNIAYNDIYGFDPTAEVGEQYNELPTPVRNGYEFVGWALEPETSVEEMEEKAIREDSVVALADNHTLYAIWQAYSFKLYINYYYSEDANNTLMETVLYEFSYGEEYSIASDFRAGWPIYEGWTPDIDKVAGVMGSGNKSVDVVFYIDSHTVSVSLVAPDGLTKLQDDILITQNYGTEYSIAVPEITGYTIASCSASDYDSVAKEITGFIGTEDLEYTVNYAYVDYSITVEFTIEYTEDFPEELKIEPEQSIVIENIHIGDTFTFDEINEITGYSVDTTLINQEITETFIDEYLSETGNCTVTVTYSPNTYTLAVEYLYDQTVADETLQGMVAATGITEELYYGQAYSIISPDIENYVSTEALVAGTMPAEELNITVYYKDISAPISVTVVWGELNFDYTEREYNAQTHQYYVPPDTEGENYITVTNNEDSGQNINVRISYEQTEDNGLTIYFTEQNAGQNSEGNDVIETVLGPNETSTRYVWMQGMLPESFIEQYDYYVSGKCTVTIGGAE